MYIAYGSNLNKEQMARRCPTAKLVGTGVVEGYELKFKGRPNGAYATIDEQEGGVVPVAVWELQPLDEIALNKYEGFPTHYFKRNIPVKMDSQEVTGMVYVMNQQAQVNLPSPFYLNTVEQGYMDCHLDTDALFTALDKTEAEVNERKYAFADDDDEDWEEAESDDEDIYTSADEDHQNHSGEVEDSRENLADWFGISDEPDDDFDEDEDEGYSPYPLHF